jgi:hypothetical protein
VVDAFTDILAKRMGLNIQAVAEPKTYNSSSLINRESKHSDPKSGPNFPESKTLRKKYPPTLARKSASSRANPWSPLRPPRRLIPAPWPPFPAPTSPPEPQSPGTPAPLP